jgi:KUP system potassium uptake protein
VSESSQSANGTQPANRRLAVVSLAALGVVYGDIGTSPLYALRECFFGEYSVAGTAANVYGVLSLMFWALVLVVAIKYLSFILRANNRGEGGVIALTALVLSAPKLGRSSRWILATVGLFAAALLYGDGMITPAISVLSAIEGLEQITPSLEPYVIPITVGILGALFVAQGRGTASIGSLFGPITLVWMIALAALGIRGIAQEPAVLGAVNPGHAVSFLMTNQMAGFVVLGAVFLVVTGAEALYADLGHFGTRPIRTAWFAVAMPALLLNYFGQGALLIARPGFSSHPFYDLAPSWATIPLVVLATAATIIASQAVISGAFSLTSQAMQLGYLPRLRILHTSEEQHGQIYVPQINWLLMVATITLVLAFQSSSSLAAAYGVAVTGTMTISTILFYVVARKHWEWSRLAAGLPAAVFLIADLAFFGANIGKLAHGAWFPLAIGAVVYLIMTTWRKGRILLGRRLAATSTPVEKVLERIEDEEIRRVPGTAVFLTGREHGAPLTLLHNLEHNKVVHEHVVLLTMITDEDHARVTNRNRVSVEELDETVHRLVARYGFMERPNVRQALALARDKGVDVPIDEAHFFVGHRKLLPADGSGMSRWRQRIFAYLERNALDPTDFYDIPPDQVVELGAQVTI